MNDKPCKLNIDADYYLYHNFRKIAIAHGCEVRRNEYSPPQEVLTIVELREKLFADALKDYIDKHMKYNHKVDK